MCYVLPLFVCDVLQINLNIFINCFRFVSIFLSLAGMVCHCEFFLGVAGGGDLPLLRMTDKIYSKMDKADLPKSTSFRMTRNICLSKPEIPKEAKARKASEGSN